MGFQSGRRAENRRKDGIGRPNQLFARTITLREAGAETPRSIRLRSILGELLRDSLNHFGIASAEAVDRLLRIADPDRLFDDLRQMVEEADLDRAAVLKLVDQHQPGRFANVAGHLLQVEQLHRVTLHIVEVDQTVAPFVVGIVAAPVRGQPENTLHVILQQAAMGDVPQALLQGLADLHISGCKRLVLQLLGQVTNGGQSLDREHVGLLFDRQGQKRRNVVPRGWGSFSGVADCLKIGLHLLQLRLQRSITRMHEEECVELPATIVEALFERHLVIVHPRENPLQMLFPEIGIRNLIQALLPGEAKAALQSSKSPQIVVRSQCGQRFVDMPGAPLVVENRHGGSQTEPVPVAVDQ